MKNFLKFVKKAAGLKASKTCLADQSDSVKIEAVQLVAEASKLVPARENVHVKMVFNEAGEMMACKVDRYKVDEAAQDPSTASTLVEKSPSPAAASATTALLKPASPAIPTFSRALPVADLKRAAAARLSPAPSPAPSRFCAADFRVLQVLGRGGQGTVLLVQWHGDGRLYALKAMKKEGLRLRDYRYAFHEQDVMKALAGNSFFAQLKASFQDDEHFYLLTDFYPGGDLLNRMGILGKIDASQAPLYCAQLVIALEELHRRRIMHRDIKPQNVLFTGDGDLVFADFGLTRTFGASREDEPWRLREYWDHAEYEDMPCDEATGEPLDATRRGCGTAAYMAPEVSAGEAYSYPADIWSLGVLLFEMLNGKLPFGVDPRERDRLKVATRIWREPVEVNEDVDVDAHDLLYMMLEKEPSRRASLEQIKKHPWFATIDWNQLAQRKQPQPLKPADCVKPTKEALGVKFGTAYPEGTAPYPWYQWVSPSLRILKRSAKFSRKMSLRLKSSSKTTPARRPSASPAASAMPVSPVIVHPALSAFFATPAIPASPAFPAFFAPPSHGSGCPVSPAVPAQATPASSVFPVRQSFAPSLVCVPLSDQAAFTSPRLGDIDRHVLRRSSRSVPWGTPAPKEDACQVLESASAGAAGVKYTAGAAPVARVLGPTDAPYADAKLDARPWDPRGVRNDDDAHLTLDALKMYTDVLLLFDAAKMRPLVFSAASTTDATRVDASPCSLGTSSLATRLSDASSPSLRTCSAAALAPRRRERCPWAFAP
ncbi:kinase-like protein [Pilatotrama ljubarskyi]|nr:kinase-like protein [Pilatotrama ljubarskyi]